MEMKINFFNWLSKKLYLFNIGFYSTIIILMVLLPFLINIGMWVFLAAFFSFFVVCFLRALYENLIIYEVPIEKLSLSKIFILSLITSVIFSFIYYFLKPSLGYFSIPVDVIVSSFIIGKLKKYLWKDKPAQIDFFIKLPEKLNINKCSTYGFYIFLVGITYIAYAKYNFNFFWAFAVAFFIGMVFEESYNLTKLYEHKLDFKLFIKVILWSLLCATISTTIVFLMMTRFGCSGQLATITSVMLVKLIQPLGSRRFIFNFVK